MKIKEKIIKECKTQDGKDDLVLELQYTHRWESWTIWVRNYNEDLYDLILKELRVAVRESYKDFKEWQNIKD